MGNVIRETCTFDSRVRAVSTASKENMTMYSPSYLTARGTMKKKKRATRYRS